MTSLKTRAIQDHILWFI